MSFAASRRTGRVPVRALSIQRWKSSGRVTSVSASASAFTELPTGRSNTRLTRERKAEASNGRLDENAMRLATVAKVAAVPSYRRPKTRRPSSRRGLPGGNAALIS